MADVTERTQTEGDQHWCSSCNSWYSGLSTDEKVIYIGAMDDDFVMPVDEFDVDDFTKTKRTARCGCEVILNAGWDETIIDVVNGDPLWECDECESVYPDEEAASYCC